MKKEVKLDQSRLLGFRIQPKQIGGGVAALGAKVGEAKVGQTKVS